MGNFEKATYSGAWRAVPCNVNCSKSWFKLVSARTFIVMGWKKFQIWRFFWMLPGPL